MQVEPSVLLTVRIILLANQEPMDNSDDVYDKTPLTTSRLGGSHEQQIVTPCLQHHQSRDTAILIGVCYMRAESSSRLRQSALV